MVPVCVWPWESAQRQPSDAWLLNVRRSALSLLGTRPISHAVIDCIHMYKHVHILIDCV
ncbi:unnamed protein product [Periconia digitata]|uniref:Uncharacterized protein n=1 Tax=Periconia digitata TaxID=1303443 RepID=A0A9W4UA24_9PLEO|nr:unnamed protein product [Periconia digitata]